MELLGFKGLRTWPSLFVILVSLLFVSRVVSQTEIELDTTTSISMSPSSTYQFRTPTVPTAAEGGTLLVHVNHNNGVVVGYGSYNSTVTTSSYQQRAQKTTGGNGFSMQFSGFKSGAMFYFLLENTISTSVQIVIIFSCPYGTFLTDGRFGCVACPALTANNEGFRSVNASQCSCKVGYYLTSAVGTNETCSVCPDSAECLGGTRLPHSGENFFKIGDLVWNDTLQATTGESFFIPCPVDGRCLPDNKCEDDEAYYGFLCSECGEEPLYTKFGDECIPCLPYLIPIPVAILLVFMFLFVWILSYPYAKLARHAPSVLSLLSFLQTISIFAGFRLGWPVYIKYFFNGLSFFNFNPDILFLECCVHPLDITGLLKEYEILFYVKIVLSLVYSVEFFIGTAMFVPFVYLYILLAKSFRVDVKFIPYLPAIWDVIVNATLAWLAIIHFPITFVLFRYFDCTYMPNGGWYLDANPNIQCWTGIHLFFMAVPIIGGVFYVLGIPLVFIIVSIVSGTALRKKQRSRMLFGSIIEKYGKFYFWWEVMVLLRKTALLVSTLMITRYVVYQTVIGIAILFVSFWLQILLQPMEYFWSNLVDSCLLACQIAILIAGLLFYSTRNPFEFALMIFVFSVIGVAIVIALCGIAFEIFWHFFWMKKRRESDMWKEYAEMRKENREKEEDKLKKKKIEHEKKKQMFEDRKRESKEDIDEYDRGESVDNAREKVEARNEEAREKQEEVDRKAREREMQRQREKEEENERKARAKEEELEKKERIKEAKKKMKEEKKKSQVMPVVPAKTVKFSAVDTVTGAVRPAVALYDFDGTEKDEISLRDGEKVEVLDSSDSQWWQVKARGKIGLVPATYIELESSGANPFGEDSGDDFDAVESVAIATLPSAQKDEYFGGVDIPVVTLPPQQAIVFQDDSDDEMGGPPPPPPPPPP